MKVRGAGASLGSATLSRARGSSAAWQLTTLASARETPNRNVNNFHDHCFAECRDTYVLEALEAVGLVLVERLRALLDDLVLDERSHHVSCWLLMTSRGKRRMRQYVIVMFFLVPSRAALFVRVAARGFTIAPHRSAVTLNPSRGVLLSPSLPRRLCVGRRRRRRRMRTKIISLHTALRARVARACVPRLRLEKADARSVRLAKTASRCARKKVRPKQRLILNMHTLREISRRTTGSTSRGSFARQRLRKRFRRRSPRRSHHTTSRSDEGKRVCE